MNKEEEEEEEEDESAEAWDLDLGPFFLSSLAVVSTSEHAGSLASFGGVGIKSKTKPRSSGELSLPIARPTCNKTLNSDFQPFHSYIHAHIDSL